MANKIGGQYSKYVYDDHEETDRRSQEDDVDLKPCDEEYEEDATIPISNILTVITNNLKRSDKHRRSCKYDSSACAVPNNSDEESRNTSKFEKVFKNMTETLGTSTVTPTLQKRFKFFSSITIGFFAICTITFVALYKYSEHALYLVMVEHADYKLDAGTQFSITYSSNIRIRFCSVTPPFNASTLHFSSPIDEEQPNVLTTDQGRTKLDVENTNFCKVVISSARVKDNGEWRMVIGTGIRDKYNQNVVDYKVKVNSLVTFTTSKNQNSTTNEEKR